jgi:hypothetical protein
MINAGAVVFGVVIGYLSYRTLVRTTDKAAISDLATVIGAVGGGAVTKIYDPAGTSFAYYVFGLAGGFIIFFLLFLAMNGKESTAKVMAGKTTTLGGGPTGEQDTTGQNGREQA